MKGDAATQKPLSPKLVLLIAILLPGMGQVANRMPTRGLMFVFYVILLAVVTYNLTTPDHSFIGRYSGGIFVYMLSVLDAYRWALYRYKVFGR
jgi:hypothetical protein